MQRIDTSDDIRDAMAALCATDLRIPDIYRLAGELPLRRSPPGFESLASIVVSQQVSKASAAAIWERFRLNIDPMTPLNYLEQGEEAWRLSGLSRAKQQALSHVSRALMEGTLDLHALCDRPADEAIRAMTAIKGIGPWTAEVYLLFCAGHPDIFPAGDVALQAAVGEALGHDERPDAKKLRVIAEDWAPWRGVAARLFWAYYAAMRGREAIPV
ncbi:MAG: DNA-3-methyladenine glycosylase family protein [Phyllobacterium sp.]